MIDPQQVRESPNAARRRAGLPPYQQPQTLLEVRQDETPAVLRDLTAAVRELVTVLREDLDGRSEDAEATEPTTPATTCSARYTGPNHPWGECIRAAGHQAVTDHTDDLGNSWTEAVAVYPIFEVPADGAHTVTADTRAQVTQLEELLRVAHETSNRSEAERAGAVQRAEAADQLRAQVQRDRDQHAAVLTEVLAAFVHKVYGYVIPRRSAEVDVVTLDKWRSMVAPTMERPWWEAVAEAKAERDQAQAAVVRVRKYLQERIGQVAVDPADVWNLLNRPQPPVDESSADTSDVVHREPNPQASDSPAMDDGIRAYIETALREGYWKEWNKHCDRLLKDVADWSPVGILGSVEGLDDRQEDPAARAFAWPHLHGKTALTARLETSFTYSRSRFDEAVHVFDALYRARLDRRLARLARALGQWEDIVRRDFHAVQRVLEDAGVLDGYGRLTIPQPVRPPIIWGTP